MLLRVLRAHERGCMIRHNRDSERDKIFGVKAVIFVVAFISSAIIVIAHPKKGGVQ
jgi:uncharacterized membrane protein